MRALTLFRYHFARQYKKQLLFIAALLALSLCVACVLIPNTRSITTLWTDEGASVSEANLSMAMYENPDAFTSPALLIGFVWVSALWLTGRERRFLVTLSVSRWEILAGTFLYLIALSATMTFALWLVGAIGRLALMGMGFSIRAGWSAGIVLTGGNPLWLSGLLREFCAMVACAGVFTLVGYLLSRWWRVFLALFCVALAFGILFVTQVRLGDTLTWIYNLAERVLKWMFHTALPAIFTYFQDADTAPYCLRQLALGAACTLASYPVMFRTRAVK